jgi:hypothetical protein
MPGRHCALATVAADSSSFAELLRPVFKTAWFLVCVNVNSVETILGGRERIDERTIPVSLYSPGDYAESR